MRKSKNFLYTLLLIPLFFSCALEDVNNSLDMDVKEYFDYWANTCQFAEIQYTSENTLINGIPNLSAAEDIKINLIIVNPKNFSILNNPDSNKSCFSFVNESDTLEYFDYEEKTVDPCMISIKTKLYDDSEGEFITLKGCLWPENRTGFSEEMLRAECPGLFIEKTFRQNTPPDNIKNMHSPESYFGTTLKHYISFDIPDQKLNRNLGSTYEIKYYLRDNGFHYKGMKILSLDDNKNTGSTTFNYYFDNQEDYLEYEYTVQVIGPRGLKSELLSTTPGLGVNQLCEPVIKFIDEPNGLYDEDGYECFEVKNNSDEITFTADTAFEGEELSVTIDTQKVIGENFKVKDIGQHEITLTSTKNGSRPVTVTKKIRIVKTPEPASFIFKYNSAPAVFNTGTEASGYEYVEVEQSSSKINYAIDTQEEDTTVAGTVDSTDFENATSGTLSVGPHNIKAVISKNYCRDVTVTRNIMVAKQLESPSYSFTVPLSGNTINSYECIEVSDSSKKTEYTVKPADADTGAKLSGTIGGTSFTSTSLKKGEAGIGEYIFTITVTKDYMQNRTFTKKIKVIEQLQEPEILFFASNTRIYNTKDAENSTYSSSNGYECYNINLTKSGTGNISYETSESTNTISITDEKNKTIDKKGTLELGPHEFSITVSKQNYVTRNFKKKIYVQGILSEPEFTSTNGTKEIGSGNSSSDPQKWKFSYLTYENLKCSINAGNTGNTITLKQGNNNISNSFNLKPDETYTINITQEQQYCKKLVTTKYISVNIKPITISNGECALYCHFDDGAFGGKNDLHGNLYIGKNSNYILLKQLNPDNGFKKNEWDSFSPTNNFSEIFYSTKDYINYMSQDVYEKDDSSHNDEIQEVSTSIQLSALAYNKRKNIETKIEVTSSGSNQLGHRIMLNLSD